MIHNFFLFYRIIPVFLPFFDILYNLIAKMVGIIVRMVEIVGNVELNRFAVV